MAHPRSFVVAGLLLGAGCAPETSPPAPPPPADLVAATARFRFHSNFWLNLHHTLYKMAGAEGRTPVAPAQLDIVDRLPPEERALWDSALVYYRNHHLADDIRSDDTLFLFKRWVLDLPADTVLASADFDPAWLARLNAVAPVYAGHFWPDHDARNRAVLAAQLETIEAIEEGVFERVARWGRGAWPPERIRVDLSMYANWAGAYTTNDPVTHVVLSSADVQPPGNWLELLFHEPSHGIIGPWSPLGEAIDSAAARAGIEPPGQLWHALLFYFSGRAVQDGLASLGRSHTLYMVDKNVFGRTQPLLFEYAEPYVTGEITLDEALDDMLAAMASR